MSSLVTRFFKLFRFSFILQMQLVVTLSSPAYWNPDPTPASYDKLRARSTQEVRDTTSGSHSLARVDGAAAVEVDTGGLGPVVGELVEGQGP